MNHGLSSIHNSIRYLETPGRNRFAARTRDLFRIDEPRQHTSAWCKGTLYEVSPSTTRALPGLERSTRCSDILRRLWLPDHVNYDSTMGRALECQATRFLHVP